MPYILCPSISTQSTAGNSDPILILSMHIPRSVSDRLLLHEQIEEFVEKYLKRQLSVAGMNRLHREFFSESADFTRWKEVRKHYSLERWSQDEFQEFVQYSKRFIAEDLQTISEAYLVSKNQRVRLELNPEALQKQYPYNFRDADNKSGFVAEKSEGRTEQGAYIHVQDQISVQYSGEIDRYEEESVIPFEYDPEYDIIVCKSTYPPDLFRLISAFNRHTDVKVDVLNATERVHPYGVVEVCDKIDTIMHTDDVSLLQVDIELADQLSLKEFDEEYEPPRPPNILSESELFRDSFEHIPWIKSAEVAIKSNNERYEFKILSSNQFFYTQIRNPPRRKVAKSILTDVRDIVMDVYR